MTIFPVSRPAERGQELVEFALIVPVLLMIVVGIFDLGRAFYSIIVINNAAREGARYAINHPDERSDWSNAKSVAIQDASNSGITLTTSDVTVTCPDANGDDWCDSGEPVGVSVSYDFQYLFGLFLPDAPLSFTRQVEMMVP